MTLEDSYKQMYDNEVAVKDFRESYFDLLQGLIMALYFPKVAHEVRVFPEVKKVVTLIRQSVRDIKIFGGVFFILIF